MQTRLLVLAAFVLGNTSASAEPVLTGPGSGTFEYTFVGNAIAQFGATELLTPGEYGYPPNAIFLFPRL